MKVIDFNLLRNVPKKHEERLKHDRVDDRYIYMSSLVDCLGVESAIRSLSGVPEGGYVCRSLGVFSATCLNYVKGYLDVEAADIVDRFSLLMNRAANRLHFEEKQSEALVEDALAYSPPGVYGLRQDIIKTIAMLPSWQRALNIYNKATLIYLREVEKNTGEAAFDSPKHRGFKEAMGFKLKDAFS